MKGELPLTNGAEYDVLTGWRKVLKVARRAGYCSAVKRAYRRRVRRAAKRSVQEEEP